MILLQHRFWNQYQSHHTSYYNNSNGWYRYCISACAVDDREHVIYHGEVIDNDAFEIITRPQSLMNTIVDFCNYLENSNEV